MFMYCARCGFIKNMKTKTSDCPACEIPLKPVPGEFLTKTGLMFASQSARAELEEMIKKSPEYDENANMQSGEIIAQKEEAHRKEVAQKAQEYKDTRPQIQCPVCHSTSLTKISNAGKIAKVGAFGLLGAGGLGKTWKCKACGCKF